MTAKTQTWVPDTHTVVDPDTGAEVAQYAFHLAYDSDDPESVMTCFRAVRGRPVSGPAAPGTAAPNGAAPHTDIFGDEIFEGAAAAQLYATISAEHQAINQERNPAAGAGG